MAVSEIGSIEFVVSESAFVGLRERQKHVEVLFEVIVSASDTSNHGGLKWVKVNGLEKPRMKAKEYITSLGQPEVEEFIPVEQLIDQHLSDFKEFLFDLEKKSSASITIREDSVRVAGSALSVEFVRNLLQNNNFTELPYKRARFESTSTLDEEDSALGEELSDSLEAVDTLMNSFKHDIDDDDIEEEGISMASSIDDTSQVETSQDFAAKLGYSKEMYTVAVKKVGKSADRNELLNELVKLKNSAKELNEERYADQPTKVPERRRSSCSSIPNVKQLRAVIIDGSNVAMSHGKQKIFSCRGIAIAVDWFKRRCHKSIYVVIPNWRKESPTEQFPMSDQDILRSLDEAGHVIYTPSRTVKGKRIVCYDDRYIMKVACEKDGVIVSNDNFRDLIKENADWKRAVEERLLMYAFVDDQFMPPDDPHGRHGPTIDDFLTVNGSGTKSKVCQYGRFCTYGRHCKYAHPERDQDPVLRDSPSNCPRPYSEPVPITDNFCDDFKRVLSLPNLNGQGQSVGVYSMHNILPPAIPSRRVAPPPIPPRGNDVLPRGMRTMSENPYSPLPVAMAIDQAVMQPRRQPRTQPRHSDYDTLPLPIHARSHIPHAGHGHYHQYTNIPTGFFINNGTRRRGGPYDNIPPPGGQMPVYPTRGHGICAHSTPYYISRAPPVEDNDKDEKPPLPTKMRQNTENIAISQTDLEKLMLYAKKLDEKKKNELSKNPKSCRGIR